MLNSQTFPINKFNKIDPKDNVAHQSALKVLFVSQKGGVGKSTLSANFAAWNAEKLNKTTTLFDFDPHGSASTWINSLPTDNINVHHTDISDFVAQRWFISARSLIRKNDSNSELIVTDLTWTCGMNTDFINEFDLVVIPCSVSRIELEATQYFAELIIKNSNTKFFSHKPTILLCPSQVSSSELKDNPFTSANFNFPYMLLPPLPSNPEVRSLFKKGYVFNSQNLCKPFELCFKAIVKAGEIKLEEKSTSSNKVEMSAKPRNREKTFNKLNGFEDKISNKKNNVWLTANSMDSSSSSDNAIKKVSKILKTSDKLSKKKKKSWLQRMRYWS